MSHSRRRPPKVRIIALAVVCCVAVFAFSASAFGMPIRGPINVATGPHAAIPAVLRPLRRQGRRQPGRPLPERVPGADGRVQVR